MNPITPAHHEVSGTTAHRGVGIESTEVSHMKMEVLRANARRLTRFAAAAVVATAFSMAFATSAFAHTNLSSSCGGCHPDTSIAVACFQASTTTTSTSYNISAPGAASWAVFDSTGNDLVFAAGSNPIGSSGLFTVPNGASYTVYAVGSTGLLSGRTTVAPGGGSSTSATCTLTYTAGEGGTISGTAHQVVDLYGNGTAVTAVPDAGHWFVMWSDGVRTATRTDTAVTSNVDLEAVFLPVIDYALTYAAGPGGHLSGLLSQTVAYGADGTAVTAIADSGYYFAGWSDGVTGATRTEEFVTSDTSVTANFALRKATSISLKSSRASQTHGRYVTLTAILKGGVPAGTKVVFQVKAPGKRTYATIGSVSVSSLGVALKKYTVAYRGTYYFRVKFSGNTMFKASTSSPVKVTSR